MKILSIFKALSDETRLRLFNLLINHELNVNEIVDIMEMGQSRISRHLKILNSCGLLTSRRDGLWTFYQTSQFNNGHSVLSALVSYLKDDQYYANDLKHLENTLDELQKQKVKYFDSIAPTLDVVKYDIIGEDVISNRIVSYLDRCNVVADLGCGTADLVPFLLTKCNHIIGIDRSMKMLDLAREKYKNAEQQVDLRIGEIEYLPMKDHEADSAVINMVLHYLQSPQLGIKECGRILKTGGQLIIVDLLKHSDEELRSMYGHRWLGFDLNEIEKWLIDEHFTVTKTETINAKNNLKILFVSAVYQ